jgi:regulator of replication initiation timing
MRPDPEFFDLVQDEEDDSDVDPMVVEQPSTHFGSNGLPKSEMTQIRNRCGPEGADRKTCFNCQKEGHIARRCPEAKKAKGGGNKTAIRALADQVIDSAAQAAGTMDALKEKSSENRDLVVENDELRREVESLRRIQVEKSEIELEQKLADYRGTMNRMRGLYVQFRDDGVLGFWEYLAILFLSVPIGAISCLLAREAWMPFLPYSPLLSFKNLVVFFIIVAFFILRHVAKRYILQTMHTYSGDTDEFYVKSQDSKRDLRPDGLCLADIKHDSMILGRVSYERRSILTLPFLLRSDGSPRVMDYGIRRRKVLSVSVEALSHVINHDMLTYDMSPEDSFVKIERALSKKGTIKMNRYDALTQDHPIHNSALLAYAMHMSMYEVVDDAGVPFPRPGAAAVV